MKQVYTLLKRKLHSYDRLISLIKQTLQYSELWEDMTPASAQPNNLEVFNVPVIVFIVSITACLTADVNEGELKQACKRISHRVYLEK